MYRSSTGKLERWFKPDWISLDHIPTTPVDYPLLKVRGWRGRGEGEGRWEAGRLVPERCVGVWAAAAAFVAKGRDKKWRQGGSGQAAARLCSAFAALLLLHANTHRFNPTGPARSKRSLTRW